MKKEIKWGGENQRKHSIIIPKEFVIGIGGSGDKDIQVELVLDRHNHQIILKSIYQKLPEPYKALKIIMDMNKTALYYKKKDPKKYKDRIREFFAKIKEIQIKKGIIEHYAKAIEKDQVYEYKDSDPFRKNSKPKIKKISREQRKREMRMLVE